MIDFDLVKYGMYDSLTGLVQQAAVSAALAEAEAEALAAYGWTAELTEALRQSGRQLESEQARLVEARRESQSKTATEKQARNRGKAFKRLLDSALNRYYRNVKAPLVASKAFELDGLSLNSTPQHSAYLGRIRPHVQTLAATLSPLMGGVDPVAELDAAKEELDGAQVEQERALQELPGTTLEIYESKGRVLRLINDLNDAGRAAFDGQAQKRARFNKDLLLRR